MESAAAVLQNLYTRHPADAWLKPVLTKTIIHHARLGKPTFIKSADAV
jgi:hypothetical protein